MKYDLKNKIVLITGATGGVGEALSRKFAEEKATLVLVSKSQDKLKTLAEALDTEVDYFACDFTDIEQVISLAQNLNKKYSTIDILLHSAGLGVYKSLRDVTLQEWQDSFSINVDAPFILNKALLPLLHNSVKPLILTIGSGAGIIPMRERSVYCSTKFALRGLILSLAEEYKDDVLDFCLVSLGSTLTDFGPLSIEEKKKQHEKGKAYFTPEWVADKIVEIITSDNRETEYELYPSTYGFGNWIKP